MGKRKLEKEAFRQIQAKNENSSFFFNFSTDKCLYSRCPSKRNPPNRPLPALQTCWMQCWTCTTIGFTQSIIYKISKSRFIFFLKNSLRLIVCREYHSRGTSNNKFTQIALITHTAFLPDILSFPLAYLCIPKSKQICFARALFSVSKNSAESSCWDSFELNNHIFKNNECIV